MISHLFDLNIIHTLSSSKRNTSLTINLFVFQAIRVSNISPEEQTTIVHIDHASMMAIELTRSFRKVDAIAL